MSQKHFSGCVEFGGSRRFWGRVAVLAGLAALGAIGPVFAQAPPPPVAYPQIQFQQAPPAQTYGNNPYQQPAIIPPPGYTTTPAYAPLAAPAPQGMAYPTPPPGTPIPAAPQPFAPRSQMIPIQSRTVLVEPQQQFQAPPVPQPVLQAPVTPNVPGQPQPPGPVVTDLTNIPQPLEPARIPPSGRTQPIPGLPPGATMGGFPAGPEIIPDPTSPIEQLRNAMTLTLRDGGVLRPYGLFRGDLDFATNHFNNVQYPLFVLPSDPRFLTGPGRVPGGPHDFNYSLYPSLTRLGLEYYGKPLDNCFNITPSGRLEFDFLGTNPGDPAGREQVRLRLAYVQLQRGEWTLVVGQDWDIIAPLVPTINDNSYMWNAGNLGAFRPQVKLLWDHDLGRGYTLQVQNGIALADTINGFDRDGNGFADNSDSGVPSYQGRLGLLMPSTVCDQKIMLGGWGFWLLDRTRVPTPDRELFPGWGAGLDLRVPLTTSLAFQGEFFHGKNMRQYQGGIDQGINPVTGETIASTGGWAELVYHPVRFWQGAAGFSMDNPDGGEVPFGGRTRNMVWYLGNRFPVGNNVTFGADFEHWRTDYNGLNHGIAERIKFFCQLAF